MKSYSRLLICLLVVALWLTACAPVHAHAQTLPTPTVRILVQTAIAPVEVETQAIEINVQTTSKPAAPLAVQTNPPVQENYCLWPGDTLYELAQDTQVSLERLQAWNPNFTGFAGSVLRLPPESLPPTQWTSPRPAFTSIDQIPMGISGLYLGYDNRQKRVALTFDIGFEPENKQLFENLSKLGIRATFFVLGESVARHPEMIADILENGHELGNHSWSHLDLQNMTEEQMVAELEKTEQAVRQAYPGATTKPFFRAPFGSINSTVVRIAKQEGFSPIGWTIDSHDWMDDISTEAIYQSVTYSICPGAIIAFHDVNQANREALPRVIEFLQASGYAMVPLSELILPQP